MKNNRPPNQSTKALHLCVVSTFPPSRGTLTEYAEHLVRALLDLPEVAKVTVLADATNLPESIQHPKLEVRRVWRFNDPFSLIKIQSALRTCQASGVLYNLQFASFGDQKIPAALGLLSPMVSRVFGTPSICLLHNIMETVDFKQAGFGHNPVMERITRAAGWLFTKALLGSSLVGTTMPRYVKILKDSYNAKNVFHSPHGAFSTRVPKPLPSTRTVMTFGKFGTYKTIESLIQAHQILLSYDKTVQLVIAGSDSPNAVGYLERTRQKYIRVPNITFTGYVPEEQVAEIFEQCSVVAFPYKSTTGSSGVLHQAGEYARAAVMPQIGDLADLIKDEGYQAEFFEPENPKSLAEALWRVLESTGHATSLGLANYRAATDIQISDVAAEFVKLFQRLNFSSSSRAAVNLRNPSLPVR
jgi:glycosyltransferase involved in cell wall biosynthesis